MQICAHVVRVVVLHGTPVLRASDLEVVDQTEAEYGHRDLEEARLRLDLRVRAGEVAAEDAVEQLLAVRVRDELSRRVRDVRLGRLFDGGGGPVVEVAVSPAGKWRELESRVRRIHQGYFRDAFPTVISAVGYRWDLGQDQVLPRLKSLPGDHPKTPSRPILDPKAGLFSANRF